jgi:glyoxylase-like metal-dependent hydrolase (beta-lactamase superfamily II)
MQQTAEHFLGYTVHALPPAPLLFYEALSDKQQQIHVLPTPGHTPGSISIQFDAFPVVFTGDTLFAGGLVGDTSHAYSSPSDLKKSLRALYALEEKTTVFPGHGESATLYEIQTAKKGELV